MITTTNVLVNCNCGMIPLNKATHRDAQAAWSYLAGHVALNPNLCKPTMTKVDVPLALSV